MEDRFRYRRLPAVFRKIGEMQPEKDVRVRIFGTIIDKTDTSIIIDDGTGKAEIILDSPTDLSGFVRVFARVIPLEQGLELRGEIIQDMNNVNINVYKKVFLRESLEHIL